MKLVSVTNVKKKNVIANVIRRIAMSGLKKKVPLKKVPLKKGLLYNINMKKKAGTSNTKANSTVSPKNFKKMKTGKWT